MRIIITTFLLPLTLAAILPSNGGDGFDLLVDQVMHIANNINNSSTSSNVVGHGKSAHDGTTKSHQGAHVPGWNTNICVNLCPKWCQRSPGNQTVYTNCHYVCGNICHKQTRNINHFLGNPAYEVVPSSFEFSAYDKNKDKRLSIEEIARTDGVQPDDIRRLFQFADFNYDGFLDYDEFQGGPFVFTVQMAAELTAVAKSTPGPADDSD